MEEELGVVGMHAWVDLAKGGPEMIASVQLDAYHVGGEKAGNEEQLKDDKL